MAKKRSKSNSQGASQGAWGRYDEYTQKITDNLIAKMEEGTSIFQQPWEPGEGAFAMPYNASTGKCYSGANAMILLSEQMDRGYGSAQWQTYKQGQEAGGNVRKGEHGVQLVKWVETYKKAEPAADGAKAAGKDEEEKEKQLLPILFTVFHRSQFDGLPQEIQRELPTEQERHEQCEQLIKDSGVAISHDGGNRAFYRPSTDSVHLPERDQFYSADGYYATVLHELGHATGAQHRLGRDLTGKFGSEAYAKEELRAELGSLFMGDRLAIGHDIGQHAAYVQSWIKILKDDPKEIWHAAKDAEAICQHLGVEKYERQAQQSVKLNAEQQFDKVQKSEQTMTTDQGEQRSLRPVRTPEPLPSPEPRRDQGWEMTL